MIEYYDIKDFPLYKVSEEGQILKIVGTGAKQKIKVMATELRNGFCYIKLFDSNGDRKRLNTDLIIYSAKRGLSPLSDDAKRAFKEQKRQHSIMDQVKLSVNSFEAEEAVVQTVRAEIIRETNYLGFESNAIEITADIVARAIVDYFRLWYKTRAIEEVIVEKSREGNERRTENALFAMKDRAYNNVMLGLKNLGLTFSNVLKELPIKTKNVVTDLFDNDGATQWELI